MKQHLGLMLMVSFFSVSCNSQDIAAEKVPAVVINALKTHFPNAVNPDWEKESAFYEADFDAAGGVDVTVQIDAAGKVLMHKTELGASDWPAALQSLLQNQYKDFTADEVERVEKGGVVFYQVELEGKGSKSLKNKKLVLAENGRETVEMRFWD